MCPWSLQRSAVSGGISSAGFLLQNVNTSHRFEMDFWILSLEGLVLTYLLTWETRGFSASPRKFLLVWRTLGFIIIIIIILFCFVFFFFSFSSYFLCMSTFARLCPPHSQAGWYRCTIISSIESPGLMWIQGVGAPTGISGLLQLEEQALPLGLAVL